jgi:hypothetical protein
MDFVLDYKRKNWSFICLTLFHLDTMMMYCVIVLLICITCHQFTIVNARTNDDDPESLWSIAEGNSQNTH